VLLFYAFEDEIAHLLPICIFGASICIELSKPQSVLYDHHYKCHKVMNFE